jgi:hypothetical protein
LKYIIGYVILPICMGDFLTGLSANLIAEIGGRGIEVIDAGLTSVVAAARKAIDDYPLKAADALLAGQEPPPFTLPDISTSFRNGALTETRRGNNQPVPPIEGLAIAGCFLVGAGVLSKIRGLSLPDVKIADSPGVQLAIAGTKAVFHAVRSTIEGR